MNATSIGRQPAGTDEATSYIQYAWIYKNILAPVLANRVRYRITEANDYLHGVTAARDGSTAALWALDYMHTAPRAFNFHSNPWLPTDSVVTSANPCPTSGCKNYRVTPKGYAMKAFDLDSRGDVEPITIFNPKAINVAAYAIGSGRELSVTIVNKTHSSTSDASDAKVTIVPDGATSVAWKSQCARLRL